jgi:hypothetical protein
LIQMRFKIMRFMVSIFPFECLISKNRSNEQIKFSLLILLLF